MSEEVETKAPLFDERIALGSLPVSGDVPAGPSMRYEPEFEAIETEVKKIDSGGLSAVNWGQVAPASVKFIGEKSKDLLVAAYGAFALFRTEKTRGLAVGLGIIDEMLAAHWDGVTPPRERARAAALEWVATRLAPEVAAIKPQNNDAPALESALASLEKISARLSEQFKTESVNFRDLLQPLRGHVSALRQVAEEARRRAENEAKAAEAKRIAAEEEAARRAAEAEARAEAANAAQGAADQALAALGGLGGAAGGSHTEMMLGALNAVAQLRLREGTIDYDTIAMVVAGAMLRLSVNQEAKFDGKIAAPPEEGVVALHSAIQSNPAERSLLAASFLLEQAPQALSIWRHLEESLLYAPAGSAAPIRAAVRVLLDFDPSLPERVGTDEETVAWLAAMTPKPPQENPLVNAKAQAETLVAEGATDNALAVAMALRRGASTGRDAFAGHLLEAKIAIAAGEYEAAFSLLRPLQEISQRRDLASWDPELAATTLELTCRCISLGAIGRLSNPEDRVALYSENYEQLCALDIALALQVSREAPKPL